MGRENFNIPDQKYDDALTLIVNGESVISEIAKIVDIDWKTAKKIYTDPDTHQMIAEQANDKLKNSVGVMTDILVDIAKFSERDSDRLTAIERAMGLAGMTVVSKQEIKTDLSGQDKLSAILDQVTQHNSPVATVSNTSSKPLNDDEEADDA